MPVCCGSARMSGVGLRGGRCAVGCAVGLGAWHGLARRQDAGLPGGEERFEAGQQVTDAAVDEEEPHGAVHHLGRMAREAARAGGDEGGFCFHVSYYI